MKKVAFLAAVAVLGLAVTGAAQQNSAWNLLESPYKIEAEFAGVGETLKCTAVVLGGTGSLFECDQIFGTAPVEFVGNELVGTYRVQNFDENCAMITSWSTTFTGPTLTGITVDEPGGQAVYWGLDPFGTGQIDDYVMFSGAPGPGTAVNVAPGFPGVWGPLALDNNQVIPTVFHPAYSQDIAADQVVEYDLVSGSVGCSFANPDNTGSGAFGNGMSEAVDPSACSGATLVMTSGTILEGQVTRGSQVDCSGTVCLTTWDMFPTYVSGEFFVNGSEEFSAQTGAVGEKRYMVLGNVTSLAFNMGKPVGISDCQGADSPDSDVLYVNSSQGGGNYTVGIDNTAPLGLALQNPPAGGNGKYVVHLNGGSPSGGTITGLPAGLGSACHPLLIPPGGSAAPVCIWNNIGKTNKVGTSSYFGTPISSPPKAPVYFWTDANGDSANFPVTSQFTIQGVIINLGSSSPKNASVTNAVLIDVTAGV